MVSNILFLSDKLIKIISLGRPNLLNQKSMTKKKPIKILSVDPGTREMGVAILEEDTLIYYGVKSIKQRKTPHKRLKEGNKIISQLIDDYEPNILVIEKAFYVQSKNSSLLITLTQEIMSIGRAKKLKVYEYAPTHVKKIICQSGKATKKEVARTLTNRYPELSPNLTQNRLWKEKYWQNMFDAVALGLTCYTEIRKINLSPLS